MRRRRIGILTDGGDCPGLNAAIRAVVKAAMVEHRIEVVGIQDGFRGLVDGATRPLSYDDVSGILTQGGTFLGSSNRHRLFALKAGSTGGGAPVERDRTADALSAVRHEQLDGLICTGGDGTLTVAHHLDREGIPMIGIPKTIDNDVALTDRAIGFDSATALATESVDRLHSTAASHHRVLVVEVMGRHAGWIALHAGLAGGGDIILIPEIDHSMDEVARVVFDRARRGRRFSIVVLAEGAGRAADLCSKISERTRLESRPVVLGYLQRGGTPTPADRLLATELGYAAIACAARGDFGRMVAWRSGKVDIVPLSDIAGRNRVVPTDHPLLAVARGVGTSFGDRINR